MKRGSPSGGLALLGPSIKGQDAEDCCFKQYEAKYSNRWREKGKHHFLLSGLSSLSCWDKKINLDISPEKDYI